MTTDKKFDASKYWIDRHEGYRDDPRSVGNMAATRELNEAGEEKFKSLVAHIARMTRGRTVLDIGCGYGRAAGPFIGEGYSYTGIDVSPVAVEKAKINHPTGEFVVQDLEHWMLTKKYDVVCALFVFVHFVDDGAWKNILEASIRSVAKGGQLIIADQFPNAREQTVAHAVVRPVSEYTDVLSGSGFVWDEEFASGLVRKNPENSQARFFRVAVAK